MAPLPTYPPPVMTQYVGQSSLCSLGRRWIAWCSLQNPHDFHATSILHHPCSFISVFFCSGIPQSQGMARLQWLWMRSCKVVKLSSAVKAQRAGFQQLSMKPFLCLSCILISVLSYFALNICTRTCPLSPACYSRFRATRPEFACCQATKSLVVE